VRGRRAAQGDGRRDGRARRHRRAQGRRPRQGRGPQGEEDRRGRRNVDVLRYQGADAEGVWARPPEGHADRHGDRAAGHGDVVGNEGRGRDHRVATHHGRGRLPRGGRVPRQADRPLAQGHRPPDGVPGARLLPRARRVPPEAPDDRAGPQRRPEGRGGGLVQQARARDGDRPGGHEATGGRGPGRPPGDREDALRPARRAGGHAHRPAQDQQGVRLPQVGHLGHPGPDPPRVLPPGVASAGGSALFLGLAAFVSRLARGLVHDALAILNATSVFVWIVISIIWFGLSNWAPIFTTFMITLPVVASNLVEGVADVDRRLLEMGDVYRLSGGEKFRAIVIPSTLPYLVAGMKVGFGLALKVSVVAEIFGVTSGIGYIMNYSREILATQMVFVWALVMILVMMATDSLVFGSISRRLARWK